MTDTLSAAGSSTYDSSTMYVGDGTWDSTRNDFLLPNLVGLNFDTMQYNGMGNRFKGLPEYHTLIRGHGIVAAITFLLVVPSAIFIARFYYRDPRLALRLHIYLQILTVFLSTVVLILGWFAVGPERSLTNPHHGIGVAIYTLIMFQAISGSLMHRIEKGKQRFKLPIKLMLHQWLGRAIALLGITQIALGLTLYGSPKVLFILYALAVFAWLLLLFVLSYRYQGDVQYESDYGSYVSGRTGASRTDVTEDRRSGHGLRDTAIVGAGLAGLAALRRKSQNRREERTRRQDAEIISSRRSSRQRPGSGSYVEEEKMYDRPEGQKHSWRNRLLGAGVGLGAYEGAKRLFSRRGRDEEEDVGVYNGPLGGNQSISRTDISRVQAGQAPFSPGDNRIRRDERVQTAQITSPTRQGLRPRRSGDSFSSYDSRDSYDGANDDRPQMSEGNGIGGRLAALSGLAYLREKQRERRMKKENIRLENERFQSQDNSERINRVNNQRNRTRFGDEQSQMTETIATGPERNHDNDMMGGNAGRSRQSLPNTNMPPLPASAAALPPGSNRQSTATETGYSNTAGLSQRPMDSRPIEYPPPPPGPPPMGANYPASEGPLTMPVGPVEHDPSRLVQSNNSRIRFEDEAATAAAGGAAGAALANQRRRERSNSRLGRRDSNTTAATTPGSVISPPISVKMKIHDDNRHITLRRLNEQEAAAEREARRKERRQRRRRAESLSSGVEDEGTRFRRNDGVRPVTQPPITNIPPPPTMGNRPPDELNLPSPQYNAPPVPAHSSPHGGGIGASPSQLNSGLTSGGYDTGTGTEMSAFDDNRRRRRAERAAAKQRAAQQGARVDFT